jgi:hypothetical protein
MRFLRTDPSVWEAAYSYQVPDFEVSGVGFQVSGKKSIKPKAET